MSGYRIACWQHGLIGKAEVHPLRRIQAMLRFRAAEADAIERWLVLCDIKAELAADTDQPTTGA